MWRPRSRPIVAIIVAEFAATPRASMRVFQTFVVGKIGQPEAPGRVGAGTRSRRGWGIGSRSRGFGVAVGGGAARGAHAATEPTGRPVTNTRHATTMARRRRTFTAALSARGMPAGPPQSSVWARRWSGSATHQAQAIDS